MTRRERVRIVLLLAGVLPALLVLAYAAKVAVMVDHVRDGRLAFDRGDYAAAHGEFADNRTLNWFESWVAEFDEGTAHHAEGEYDDAIADYEAALDDVPRREECTVRINLALAHESVGDARIERNDREGAAEAWQAGIDALAEGGCPQDSARDAEQTEDAEAVDRRLREKLQESAQQEPRQGPDGEQQQRPEDGDEPRDPREEQLERNNQQGLDQRRQDQELFEDQDYTRPHAW